MKTFVQIGIEIGRLVKEKSEAYGDSLAVTGDFLRLLWPNGIPPERYDDAFLMARLFDKQMRFATSKDAFGESPLVDAAGYCIRGIQLHQHKKEVSPLCPGNVSGSDAAQPLSGIPGSAASNISEKTTTNGNGRTAPAQSPTRESSSSKLSDATAPTATVPASASVAALQLRISRNHKWHCAGCNTPLAYPLNVSQTIGSVYFHYCSAKCVIEDRLEVQI